MICVREGLAPPAFFRLTCGAGFSPAGGRDVPRLRARGTLPPAAKYPKRRRGVRPSVSPWGRSNRHALPCGSAHQICIPLSPPIAAAMRAVDITSCVHPLRLSVRGIVVSCASPGAIFRFSVGEGLLRELPGGSGIGIPATPDARPQRRGIRGAVQPDDRARAGAARARSSIHGCCAEDNRQSLATSAPEGIPKGIRPLGGVFPLLPPGAKGVAPQGEMIPFPLMQKTVDFSAGLC